MSLEHLRARYDRWRLERFRRAYTGESGRRSSAPGYAGLIEEVRWGLEHLDVGARERADEAVLKETLHGELVIAGLGRLGAHDPRRLARLLARVAPISLRFLVGEIEIDEPGVNRLPDCRFRREGGTTLCREVCQRPTETFMRARGLPIVLEPEPESPACRWTWGRARAA